MSARRVVYLHRIDHGEPGWQIQREGMSVCGAECGLFSPIFQCLSLHLRRSTIHKYMQHDRATSHANARNTNETCLGSQTARQLPPPPSPPPSSLAFFWVPLGRIYNFTFPFSGFKVSYKSQTRLKAPRSCSTGSPAVLRGDQIRTQPNEQTCFISAVMHLLPAPPE